MGFAPLFMKNSYFGCRNGNLGANVILYAKPTRGALP